LLSYLPIRLPNKEEIQKYEYIVLTSDETSDAEWNPQSSQGEEHEQSFKIENSIPIHYNRSIYSMNSSTSIPLPIEITPFMHQIISAIAINTTTRKHSKRAHELASRWGIGLHSHNKCF
jgi:hypothetical protein